MSTAARVVLMRRLVSWAMVTWPAETRRRDGPALLDSFERELAEMGKTRFRWWMEVVRECAAVGWAGIALRWTSSQRRGGVGMGWMGDVRLAARGLKRSPGFALTVGVALALGIGANAAVSGVVDGVLFRPPPFERPGDLLFVWRTLGSSQDRFRVAAPDVEEIRRRVSALEDVAFSDRVTDGSLEDPAASTVQHVRIASVTANLLDLLGVGPSLGRGFDPDDGVAAPRTVGDGPAAGVAMLSHDAWVRLLGGAPDVLGRTLRLDGRPVTVIGVLPVGFRLEMPPGPGVAGEADVWVPLTVPLRGLRRGDGRLVDQDSDNTGAVIGRRATGSTLPQIQEELDRLASEMRSEIPSYAASDFGLAARPMHEDATRHVRGLLTAMLAGAGAVLLVTCLNVSLMILARGMRRVDELSVRTALGASRLRLARQLAVESLVLGVLGGGLAIVTAWTLSQLLATRLPASVGTAGIGLDVRMLVLGAGVTGVVLASFGLAPLTSTRVLRRSGGGGPSPGPGEHPGHDRLRRGLIVGQLALSIPLLLWTSLLLRTVQELRAVEPGFQAEGALTFDLSLRIPGRYRGPADRAELARLITDRLSAIDGVRSVGLTTHLPLSNRSWTQPYGLPGQAPHEWSENRADFRAVTSGLFDALGSRLVEGRTFTSDEDLYEQRRVAIVDELLARRLAATGPVLGTTVGIPLDGAAVFAEVVGVVEHVRHDRLDADGREAVYVPYRQEASREVSFVVRTAVGHPEDLAPSLRAAVAEVDAQLVPYGLRTLNDYVDSAVAPIRFSLDVLGLFTVLSLLAVGMGLYGLLGLDVARRRRDIGLRVAIGATRSQVVRPVIAAALRLVAVGGVLGAALAGVIRWRVGAHLYGTGLTDVRAWIAVLGTLLLVTLAGCWLPARRAAGVDPREALRGD